MSNTPAVRNAERVITVEAPYTTSVADFLDANISARLTLSDNAEGFRRLEIVVTAAVGENSSEFRYREFVCEFPPFERAEPEPSRETYAIVRIPFDRYGLGIGDPEAHQQRHPDLAAWRDAVHDGRRVDGLYMVVPDKVWCHCSPRPRLITLVLVGVEIEWSADLDLNLDDETREAIHECEDEMLRVARALDCEFVDIDMDELFTERNVWRPDVAYVNLGEFASEDEAREHWGANPPMVPTTPPAKPALE